MWKRFAFLALFICNADPDLEIVLLNSMHNNVHFESDEWLYSNFGVIQSLAA